MKISNSAVSGRSAPSYDEFVELEYRRFFRDMGEHPDWICEGSSELKAYFMKSAARDNWSPSAGRKTTKGVAEQSHLSFLPAAAPRIAS